MKIEVFGAGAQRRNAIITATELLMPKMLNEDELEKFVVQFQMGDEPRIGASGDIYTVILVDNTPIPKMIFELAVGLSILRQYVKKERRPATNSRTKYRWHGETIDTETVERYDDPSWIDAAGRAYLLTLHFKEPLAALSRAKSDQHPPMNGT